MDNIIITSSRMTGFINRLQPNDFASICTRFIGNSFYMYNINLLYTCFILHKVVQYTAAKDYVYIANRRDLFQVYVKSDIRRRRRR
jgi:hypothetical protein